MQIQVVGINHKTASLKIRARVGLTPELIADAYQRLGELHGNQGVVILSTCNRTEIYVAGNVSYAAMVKWWAKIVGVDQSEFVDAVFWYADDRAFDHLFRVAAGLDSMVLGETQILGQVKAAYEVSQRYGAAKALHRLFRYTLTVGKRAHAETGISHNALSMGHAVVELARKVFEDIHKTHALVIGSGEMGTLVGRHLTSAGVGRLTLVNRTVAKAQELAEELGADYADMAALPQLLRGADIVVTATNASGFLLDETMVRTAIRGNTQKLRFLFDLSVPRNIDPAIAKLGAGIFLYDVDDVEAVVQANLAQRQKEAVKVERIIQEEIRSLKEELAASEVGPVIRQLRSKADAIRTAELEKAMNRLPHLSAEEKAVVADTTRLILNKFLNDAMVTMRSWAAEGDKQNHIDAVRELFKLTESNEPSTVPMQGVALEPER
ncbi:glutamyl-tRNA reductase [Sulfobacillus sp. hq2]|uniref:glutamyl-tRNA reductase n=1 Tax=Sulfobacillus TaxID=28033 RepID=UPI000CD1A440|nr:glutamyl-tRNA reductase [Sulfobacillus sp. hq2]POB09504.1 glutamyl-tRNA reductase [Sulfobacillus sp. hq2]